MRFIFFFLLLTSLSTAQTYELVFNGRVTDGDTTISTTEFNLVNTAGTNLFDTLHIIIQAGDSLAAIGIVYLQTYTSGRWSQGQPLDTVDATSSIQVIYPLDDALIPVTSFLTDTTKNRWFLSTGVGTTGKARTLAKTDWRFRIFVVGTSGNPTVGGLFRIEKYVW